MKFLVCHGGWASGAPEPLEVIKAFVKAEPVQVHAGDDRFSGMSLVEVTAEELMAMSTGQVRGAFIDVMVNGWNDKHEARYLSFDGNGRRFRQR